MVQPKPTATFSPTDLDLRALAGDGPVHFVGIAGAGMSVLAELLLKSGVDVTGCDLAPGPVGERLARLSATVCCGHAPAHCEDARALVVSAAIPDEHPELERARQLDIPVLSRAQALGALVNAGTVVALSGTHGKTTTSAMTTAILAAAGQQPTGLVGGRVAGWDSGLLLGDSELFVVEADEFDRSFLTLAPDVAVVNNIEADHLDTYETLEGVQAAFAEFAGRVPEAGLVALCADDPGAMALAESIPAARRLTFGVGPDASLRARDIRMEGATNRFEVVDDGVSLGEFELRMPGLHNVRNALGAFAAARHVGATFEAARQALGDFRGIERRFEVLGEAGGVVVVSDYAHHPTELRAALDTARRAYQDRRLVAVFQPHLYTRTRDFADEFGQALTVADVAWVAGIYPAREAPIDGVTGALVADAARGGGQTEVRFVADLVELTEKLVGAVRPNDLCLVLGAGDIDGVARRVFASV